MIIDCHGHYTTAPAAHTAWREQQVAAWEAGTTPPAYPSISDDEIRETIETSQLRLMDERGIDVTCSRRARRRWRRTSATPR